MDILYLERTDHTKNGRGGGILLYIKTELGPCACNDFRHF